MAVLGVFTISDLHTDYQANVEWLEKALQSVTGRHVFTVLIVAGDVSHREDVLIATFALLVERFDLVAFVPGNHDIWCSTPDSSNSYVRCQEVRRMLNEGLGVIVQPCSISIEEHDEFLEDEQSETPDYRLLLVPLLGYHHESFDREDDIPLSETAGKPLPPLDKVLSDRRRCRWPIAEFMEAENIRKPRAALNALNEQYERLCDAFSIPPAYETDAEDRSAWQSALIARAMDDLNENDIGIECYPPEPIVRRKGNVTMTIKNEVKRLQDLWSTPYSSNQTRTPLTESFSNVISFSHFIPYPFLNPEKRFLFYPNLAKAVGSEYLGSRVTQLRPSAHIFGHTHFGWNATLAELLEGQEVNSTQNLDKALLKCRFVQAPLGYPKERAVRLRSLEVGEFNGNNELLSLLQVEKVTEQAIISAEPGYWSSRYCHERRDGTNTKLASYVKDIYQKLDL